MSHPRSASPAAALLLGASLSALICAPAAAGQLRSAPLPRNAQYAQGPHHDVFAAYRHVLDLGKAHPKKKSAHFSYPFGLGADGLGNVYVTNEHADTVSVINGSLKATSGVISQGLFLPVSVAADGLGNVFVGNLNSGVGTVTKYTNGQPQTVIAANAATPYSIALDAFDDLYLVTNTGIASDDSSGNQIFGSEYNGYGVVSVATGNTAIYAFTNDNFLVGNGSVYLRSGGLQGIVGPTGSTAPLGVACALNTCWYGDTSASTLWISFNGTTSAVQLNYVPIGVAFDPVHGRLFVADPTNNAVHVYNPQTLALEKTIT